MEKEQYTVIQTSRFKRDLKRLKKSGQYEIEKLEAVIELLESGDLAGYEECHLGFDWLLLFKRHHDILILHLIRTGTHDQLF